MELREWNGILDIIIKAYSIFINKTISRALKFHFNMHVMTACLRIFIVRELQ